MVIRNRRIFKNDDQCLAFADDLTLMAKSRKEVKKRKKIKYMIMRTKEDGEENLKRTTGQGKSSHLKSFTREGWT